MRKAAWLICEAMYLLGLGETHISPIGPWPWLPGGSCNGVVIHDGIHPSIMNRTQAISVSFRVRNTPPVQYHLVLEEAWGV